MSINDELIFIFASICPCDHVLGHMIYNGSTVRGLQRTSAFNSRELSKEKPGAYLCKRHKKKCVWGGTLRNKGN